MSPEVYDAALAVAQAACNTLGIRLEVPNQQAMAQAVPRGSLWAMFDGQGNVASPAALGNDLWDEEGQVFVHLFASTGTGLRNALVARKAVSVAYRFASNLPVGLLFHDHQFQPSDLDTGQGNWMRVTLGVDYVWQDSTMVQAGA